MNSIKYLFYNSEKYERTVEVDDASLCLLNQQCIEVDGSMPTTAYHYPNEYWTTCLLQNNT